MNISNGVVQSAQKIVIYGPEGIGKSTFAAQFPNPLFIDTEGSTKKLNVRRMDKPSSWTFLKDQVDYVIKNPGVCSTLVIDTIDWAEQLCIEDICSKAGKTGIEDFGYGNGYVYEKEEIGKFLNKLEEVVECNVNVVLTAHAQLRKFEQPDEMGAYDRWELKLGKKTASQISPLIKEWADAVFFVNYKTITVYNEQTKKYKAQGGQRVMYTSHNPCWDAKNRDCLAEELPFEYKSIAHIIPDFAGGKVPASTTVVDRGDFEEIIDKEADTPTPTPQTEDLSDLPKALSDLMKANGVTKIMIQQWVSCNGYAPVDMEIRDYPKDFINGCLIGSWNDVFAGIKENEKVPF